MRTGYTNASLCALATKYGITERWGQMLVDGMLPDPPTDDVCTWIKGSAGSCEVSTALYLSLANGGSVKAPVCDQQEAMEQALPRGNLTRLADRRPLPPEFADRAAVLEEEGATYRWLYTLLENTLVLTACGNDPSIPLMIPPGWQEVARINATQGAADPALPFVIVIENRATNQLVLLFRASRSGFDMVMNAAYNQTAAPSVPGNPSAAWGYSQLLDEVWPEVKSVLDERVVGADAPPEVWVAGYSMGGSVAQLAALAAQEHLDARMGAEAPVLNAVLFASPKAGGPELVQRFNERVNGRRISFAGDVVSQIPCGPVMQACSGSLDGKLGMMLELMQLKGVQTDQGGTVAEWPYSPVGGQLTLTTADMPQDAATWAQLARMNLCEANFELLALHGCSYHCALSAFGDDEGRGEECWLSKQPDGAPGSQCPNFPKPPKQWDEPDAQSSAAARLAHAAVLLALLALLAAVLA